MPSFRNSNINKQRHQTSSSTKKSISIVWKPEIDAYQCSFPYNADFVSFIKSKVPSGMRSCDYDASREPQWYWYFKKDWLEDVILPIMRVMYPSVPIAIIDKAKVDEYNRFTTSVIGEDSTKMLSDFKALLQSASLPVPNNGEFEKLCLKDVTILYRKAAMYYHPDRNPEKAAEMSRLNQLYTELKGMEIWMLL